MASVYRRAQHAAHYGNGTGHDLESWDVEQPFWTSPRPDDVPADAEKHSGYVEGGVQHFVYVRRAPLTGPACPLCTLRGV